MRFSFVIMGWALDAGSAEAVEAGVRVGERSPERDQRRLFNAASINKLKIVVGLSSAWSSPARPASSAVGPPGQFVGLGGRQPSRRFAAGQAAGS